MKKLLLIPVLLITLFLSPRLKAQSISPNGYPEHFIAGALIGGTVTYLTYQKTHNKFKSWGMGLLVTTGLAGLKEFLDPVVFNRYRDAGDFGYTVLGGVVGVSIAVPLVRRKEKKAQMSYLR